YSIPREQVIRPGQRRSLMRRALTGIVPDELLGRRRKAFVVRSPLVAISKQWTMLATPTRQIVTASLGIVNSSRLHSALENVREGKGVPVVLLVRTLHLELWLHALAHSRILKPAGLGVAGYGASCEIGTMTPAEGEVSVV